MQASQAPNETRLPRPIVRQIQRLQPSVGEPENPDTAAQAAPEADTAPPPPAPEDDPRKSDPTYWEQRFKVTEGVLRAERKARRDEAAAFHQRIDELQSQIRELQASAPPAPIDISAYFTPEQIEEFGEDQCRAVMDATQKSVRTQVQQAIEAEVKPLREARDRQAADAVEDRKRMFMDKLTEIVPDWQEIDANPSWLAWLAQEDEATGVERQAILDTHMGRGNATKVASMFQQFKAAQTRPAPPAAPHGGAGNGGDSGSPSPQAVLRAPTPAETRDFFKRAALGKVSDQERAQFEARMKHARAGR